MMTSALLIIIDSPEVEEHKDIFPQDDLNCSTLIRAKLKDIHWHQGMYRNPCFTFMIFL